MAMTHMTRWQYWCECWNYAPLWPKVVLVIVAGYAVFEVFR